MQGAPTWQPPNMGKEVVMSLVKWDPLAGFDEMFNRMLPASFGRLPRFAFPSNGEKYSGRPRRTSAKPTRST